MFDNEFSSYKALSLLIRAQKSCRTQRAFNGRTRFASVILPLFLIQLKSFFHYHSINLVDCQSIDHQQRIIKWYTLPTSHHKNLPIPLRDTLYTEANLPSGRNHASPIISKGNFNKVGTYAKATLISHKRIVTKNTHEDLSKRGESAIRNYLPNGPPPFRPSLLMIGLGHVSGLEKLRRTAIFKRMYKSKVYYLFLDVLRQLNWLVDSASKKKLDLTAAKLGAVKAYVHKFTWKGANALKMKWPLILLNPLFIKEVLSSPTLLVMLFHAVEVAYMSSPVKFWLKPLLRLVVQSSPEKEEKIWWRRKRLYDVLNGHGSSELQPNLKTIHFRSPGRPAPIAIPKIANFARQITGRLPPNTTLPPQLSSASSKSTSHSHHIAQYGSLRNHHHSYSQDNSASNPISLEVDSHKLTTNSAQDVPDFEIPLNHLDATNVQTEISLDDDEWLTPHSDKSHLMSQQEFDELDAKDKELVLKEFNRSLEESRWTNELIQEHSDLVESFN